MIHVKKIDTFTGHRDCIYALERSGENHRFFSAAGDGYVVRWNLEKPDVGELIAKVKNSVYSLAYLPQANQLWVAQNQEGIHVIDLETKQELRSLKLSPAYYFDIQFYDGNAFIADSAGVISVIDAETISFRKHIKAAGVSVRCLAVNPVERELAAGYSDNSIKIFDLKTYELKRVIEAHSNSVFTVRYAPDFTKLISGSRDARLKVWNVETGYKLEEEVAAHTFAINHLAFSPDGLQFVTGSMDKSVKVWDTGSLRLLKVIDRARHAGHGTSVNKVLWTNYKNQIVSGSDDRTISVWELDTDN
ncbi:WD40 repeat domain-containing protein [Emticicia sp. 21SJ11W-3]|uniref:WD40 repeat domain-containing protein n=1 Tax=Emticicia sp. 21SJ11W-3 TaxID=2916755 RepID=UPI00209FFF06|nr:WD40 repeat domain-containing protein [Emticicia sp. 21SJ11W-3]UTA69730.1 WD40 repeat domain-containing protein [Emticicia sp. 21SJ11W-3]